MPSSWPKLSHYIFHSVRCSQLAGLHVEPALTSETKQPWNSSLRLHASVCTSQNLIGLRCVCSSQNLIGLRCVCSYWFLAIAVLWNLRMNKDKVTCRVFARLITAHGRHSEAGQTNRNHPQLGLTCSDQYWCLCTEQKVWDTAGQWCVSAEESKGKIKVLKKQSYL